MAVFPFAIYFCKSAYERFSMYCITVFTFFFCDMLRYVLLFHLPGNYPSIIAFWIALAGGVAFVAGLLYCVNRFSEKDSKSESKIIEVTEETKEEAKEDSETKEEKGEEK